MRYKFENCEFDTEESTLWVDGEVVHIEPQVCRIIELLITNHGHMITRDEIQREIWGDRTIMPSVIDNRIRAARAVLGDDGKSQHLIKTFPNAGYKFVGQIEKDGAPEARTRPIPTGEKAVLAKVARPAIISAAAAALLLTVGGLTFSTGLVRSTPGPVLEKPLAPPTSNQQKIAVIPFITDANLQKEAGISLSHKMVSALSNMEPLGVVSPRSSFSFSRKSSSKEIASVLGVSYILDGMFSSGQDTYSITAQLIAVGGNEVIWSATFDGSRAGKSRLQFETEVATKIAIAVANSLGHSITGKEELLLGSQEYQHFQTGVELLSSRKAQDLARARELLSKVVDKQPDFLPALMHLSEANVWAVAASKLNRNEAIRNVAKIANRARRLSPKSPETYLALGNLEELREQPAKALHYFDLALKKNPNFAVAHLKRARILYSLSRMPQALESYKQALSFDPFSSSIVLDIARVHFSMGNIEEALRLSRRNLLWDPDDLDTLLTVAKFEVEVGRYRSAVKCINRALQLHRGNLDLQLIAFGLYSDMGLLDELPASVTHSGLRAMASLSTTDPKVVDEVVETVPLPFIASHAQHLFADNPALYEKYIELERPAEMLQPDKPVAADQMLDAVIFLDALDKNQDARVSQLRASLEQSFDSKSPGEWMLIEQFSAAIGFFSMAGHPDKALSVLDEANRRKMLFLNWLQFSPHCANLRKHPGFKKRLQTMLKNRDDLMPRTHQH